jgi:hypothetical protein
VSKEDNPMMHTKMLHRILTVASEKLTLDERYGFFTCFELLKKRNDKAPQDVRRRELYTTPKLNRFPIHNASSLTRERQLKNYCSWRFRHICRKGGGIKGTELTMLGKSQSDGTA